MAAKLAHQNIVAAYDAAEAKGLHYLVMEFVDGRDLSYVLQKQGPLELVQVLNCIRQAAEGLAYAHGQGVIHRDIKPGNLLIDKAGTVKILDMGLACTVDTLEKNDKSSNQELTQAGQVMGTVDYMAPEQARDARTADHRADIYSLGCTLYRLLTGFVPFPADTMVKKLMAHAHQPIPSLTKHCPEVSPKLEALFQRMMEKDPAKRISTAKEVAETLADLLSGNEDRVSVWVLDHAAPGDEGQSFLKAGTSTLGKGSTISKVGAVADAKSGASTVGKQGHSVAEVVADHAPKKKMILYGSLAGAAVVLLALGGWLATRGDAEEEPVPENAIAVAGTPTKPEVPIVSLPTATARPIVPISPLNSGPPITSHTAAAPVPATSPSPSTTATAVALNLPTTATSTSLLPPTPLPTPTVLFGTPVIPTSPSLASGKPIPLLPLINPARDTQNGSWSSSATSLRTMPSKGSKILQLPLNMPREFAIELTAKRLSGTAGLLFVVPYGSTYGAMVLDRDGTSGLGGVDGQAATSNDTTVRGDASARLEIGKPMEIQCVVKEGSIVGWVSGRTIIDWRGPTDRLSAKAPMAATFAHAAFLVAEGEAEFEITKFDVTPFNVPKSPVATTAPPPESGENFALSFDGFTSHVALPPTLYLPDSRVMTWEALIQLDDAARATSVIGNVKNNQGQSIDIGGDQIGIKMARRDNGPPHYTWKPTPLTYMPSRPLRIAAVFDEDQWRLFVDGRLVLDEAIAEEPVPTRNPLLIGAEGGVVRQFHGKIDEVRISSIVRYTDDYKPVERLETDEHTLALYHFNEGAGTTLYDYSGHGHHGRIVEAKWVPAPPLDPRIAPPEGSVRIKALAELDKAIQPDLLRAKAPTDKATLAQRLLTDAADVAKPGEARFAAAQRGLELALESGDRIIINQAVAAHDKDFQGSVDERLADTLTATAKKTLTPQVWQSLAALAYERWNDAYAEDQLVQARQFADAFMIVARKANNPNLTKAAGDMTKRLGTLKASIDAALAAQEKLNADPADAAAHLALGLYLCFDKEDWLPGLEHLAKGSDAALAALATQGLEAGDDLPKILAAADAWYDASQKGIGKAKTQNQEAAVFWYLESYSYLTGADRSRVETRLNQLNAKTRPLSFTQTKRERDIAEWVVSLGGTVHFIPFGETTEYFVRPGDPLETRPFVVTGISGFPAGQAHHFNNNLKRVADLRYLRRLTVNDAELPPGGFAHLGRLVTLNELTLRGIVINDEDLNELQPLVNLTRLMIDHDVYLTDTGFKYFEAFKNLTALEILSDPNKCRVTDQGIASLTSLRNLATLNVRETNMSDVGLRQLQKLTNLKQLIVTKTRVSPAGIQEFKRAVPACILTGP